MIHLLDLNQQTNNLEYRSLNFLEFLKLKVDYFDESKLNLLKIRQNPSLAETKKSPFAYFINT